MKYITRQAGDARRRRRRRCAASRATTACIPISAPGTRCAATRASSSAGSRSSTRARVPDVEIGYRLLPEAWGQGFATEGATAMYQYGFDDLRPRPHHRRDASGQPGLAARAHEGGTRATSAGAATTICGCACSPRDNPYRARMTPLATPRLVLRHFERGDVDDLFAMDSDDRVMRFLGLRHEGPHPRRMRDGDRDAWSSARGASGVWAAAREPARRRRLRRRMRRCSRCRKATTSRSPIGCRCRAGARATPPRWRGRVLAHGFDGLGLARIVGLTWPENVPSQRVLEKIGMRRQGAEHYGARCTCTPTRP